MTKQPAWWPPQQGDVAILTTPQGDVTLNRLRNHWIEASRPGVMLPDVSLLEHVKDLRLVIRDGMAVHVSLPRDGRVRVVHDE